ncbi:MAG: type II toxin-antitoxin system VapC family toxin [Polyangiaceae bacterium]
MARTVLLDTGFLVALVNAKDPDHVRCAEVWGGLRARVVTVEGVLIEAAHLLRRTRGGQAAAMSLGVAVEAEIVPLDAARLDRAAALMSRYRDAPMDLVDALLVVSAEQLSITEVLTLDRRGFGAYRIGRGKTFSILP